MPRTVEPFNSFVANSENWCFGPVFEMRLLYQASEIEAAWKTLWTDMDIAGPFTDCVLKEKDDSGKPRLREDTPPSFGSILVGREDTGFRAGVGIRRTTGEDPLDPWLDLWLPPRMVKRIFTSWDTEDEGRKGVEESVFWGAMIDLARRIKSRVPFRIAWLGDECSSPLPRDVDYWLLCSDYGDMVVDTTCPVEAVDILKLSKFRG